MKRIRLILILALFGILALGAVSCSKDGSGEIPEIWQVLLYVLGVFILFVTYGFIRQLLKILWQKIDRKLFQKLDRKIDRMFSEEDETQQNDTTVIKNEKEIQIVKENINNTDKLKEIVLSQNYTDEIRESALNYIHIRDREQIKDMLDNGDLPENIKNKVKARYDYFVQRARENREFDIKIMNVNDVRELVKETESPEELKMIIKVREYKTYTTIYENIDAQKKLRIVLGYSLDEYYCPKCNEIVKSEKRNERTSDAGRTYYDIKCPQCGSYLDQGMSFAPWYEPEKY